MITFKQYLNEAVSTDLIEFLHSNCLQAVKDSLEVDRCLWRGLKKSAIEKRQTGKREFNYDDYIVTGYVETTRKGRMPSEMPRWAHDRLDDIFEKQFGVKLRSDTLFCHARPSSSYGQPFAIVPIGDYDIYWSKDVSDLTVQLFPDVMFNDEEPGLVGGINHWRRLEIPYAKVTRSMEEEYLDQVMDEFEYIHDNNAYALMEPAHEKMVKCDRYLMLDHQMFSKWEQVQELFEKVMKS